MPIALSVCRKLNVRFSITIRQHARLRELIEAIPETDWTIPYWMEADGPMGEPDAAPVRLIVRRVKPTPGSQLALFASYSWTASSRYPGTGGRPSPPCRGRERH